MLFHHNRHLRNVGDSMACDTQALSLLQDLQMLARENPLPAGANHDVPAYTLFPHADLESTLGMQCSVSSGNATVANALQMCSNLKNGACCVNYDQQLSSTAVVSHAATNCVY